MKQIYVIVAMFCGVLLCASPYGKALKQAKHVAGYGQQKHRAAEVRKNAPVHRPKVHGFEEVCRQMNGVIKFHRGVLPGPAGAAGVKKLVGPGKIAPELLKRNGAAGLSESNCALAYTGCELGKLDLLPGGGMFPVIFTKPAHGVREVKVLCADGSVCKFDARIFRSSSDVIRYLQKSSRHGRHKVWTKLLRAAAHIDRAR